MQVIAQNLFLDRWKSFKVFSPGGRIRLHSKERFTEFHFTADEALTVHLYGNKTKENPVKNEKWTLLVKNKRHYLSVPAKGLEYEVITVNHTVLVLTDLATNEKIFFTREEFWDDYLETNKEIIL